MADKKKTAPPRTTTAPKQVRKAAADTSSLPEVTTVEITTDDGVIEDDVVTTRSETITDESVSTRDEHIVVEDGERADVTRYVTEATYGLVAQRAYERYAARGYEDGHDLEDWLAAESETQQG